MVGGIVHASQEGFFLEKQTTPAEEIIGRLEEEEEDAEERQMNTGAGPKLELFILVPIGLGDYVK